VENSLDSFGWGESQNHRLEKTSKIESNHPPNTTMPAKPYPDVPGYAREGREKPAHRWGSRQRCFLLLSSQSEVDLVPSELSPSRRSWQPGGSAPSACEQEEPVTTVPRQRSSSAQQLVGSTGWYRPAQLNSAGTSPLHEQSERRVEESC